MRPPNPGVPLHWTSVHHCPVWTPFSLLFIITPQNRRTGVWFSQTGKQVLGLVGP